MKGILETNQTYETTIKELALKLDEIRINLQTGSSDTIENIYSILTDTEFKRIRKIVNVKEINECLVDIAKLVKHAYEEEMGLGKTEREKLIVSLLSLNKIDEFVKFGIRIIDPRTPPPPVGVASDKPHDSSDSGSGSGSGSVRSVRSVRSDSDSGSGKGKKKKKEKKTKKKTKKQLLKSLKRRKNLSQ